MSVSSASGRHFIDDYTGGPEGLAPIVAHCGCGVVSRPLLTLDEADRDLEVHVPAPQHATDIRRVEIYQAYCSCGWESEPEETPEGADALADEHDDAALSARSRAVVAVPRPVPPHQRRRPLHARSGRLHQPTQHPTKEHQRMQQRQHDDLGPMKVITATPTPGIPTEPVPPTIGVKPTQVVRTSKHAAGRTDAADKDDRAKAARQAQRRARKASRK